MLLWAYSILIHQIYLLINYPYYNIKDKLKNGNRRVFGLVGDGECDEGQVYEMMHFANKYKLNKSSLLILLRFIKIINSIINKNILSRISLDKNQYDFNTVLPANIANGYLTTSVRNYQGKMDLQRLNIQLVNEYGQVMDLNGQDISLCLEIKYD